MLNAVQARPMQVLWVFLLVAIDFVSRYVTTTLPQAQQPSSPIAPEHHYQPPWLRSQLRPGLPLGGNPGIRQCKTMMATKMAKRKVARKKRQCKLLQKRCGN